jgi:EAL domain-containing protein (putative c-di-GMP-specific phosphodiesterase class I)
VRAAVAQARALPADAWLSLNFSASTIVGGHVADVTADAARSTVIEITQAIPEETYPDLLRVLRQNGSLRISVDDVGTDLESIRRALEIRPEMLKLDVDLVHEIDRDPARQALAAGVCQAAARSGATLVAEGVETRGEADVLRELGVGLGQGYLFGRPGA